MSKKVSGKTRNCAIARQSMCGINIIEDNERNQICIANYFFNIKEDGYMR